MIEKEIEKLYQIMFPDYPDIISIAQLQKMLGISRHLAYSLIYDKSIKAIHLGNAYKIPKVSVIEYVVANIETIEEKSADGKAKKRPGRHEMT